MTRRSFCDVSKAAFISLYCAILRPHLEYAMEANSLTLRADSNQLERIQRLATRLVSGHHQVLHEERFRQLNLLSLERKHLRADLILAFRIFKGEADLNSSDFSSAHPTGYTYRVLQGPNHLRRSSGAFSVRVVKYWDRLLALLVMSPSVFGLPMVPHFSGSTCVIPVPLHRHFPSSLL